MPEKDDLPSIDDFGDRLKKAKPGATEEKLKQRMNQNQGTALGRGMRVASELLAGLLVAGALGYGLDQLLGTLPWFMLAGCMLGFAAGFKNVQRAMDEMNESLEQADKDE